MSNKKYFNPPEILVIGVGLPRTGTSSLKAALEILYNTPCYKLDEVIRKRRDHILKWQSLMDQAKFSKCGIINKQTVYELLEGYKTVVDIPVSVLHKEMMAIFPNAKFIFSWRDKNDWLNSMRDTISLNKNQLFGNGLIGSFIIKLLLVMELNI
ncbi:unnamed protein product [Heterobilharzia americana]|nr:unnamed protein product [Heterobilharzia americana]